MNPKAIKLGNQLVDEMGSHREIDTLSRWMAHHLAEKMTAVENATAETKKALEKECFMTILSLWKHRAYFPKGHRPFQNLTQVVQILEKLNPENEEPFYHGLRWKADPNSSPDPGSIESLMEVIVTIDSATRTLIDLLFDDAIRIAADESTRTMLENALPGSSMSDINAFRVIIQQYDDSKEKDNKQKYREAIELRIAKLREFDGACKKLQDALEKQLTDL